MSLKRESLKFGIHTFSDPAESDTHQGICACMCLNKKLLADIYSLLIFNTFYIFISAPVDICSM